MAKDIDISVFDQVSGEEDVAGLNLNVFDEEVKKKEEFGEESVESSTPESLLSTKIEEYYQEKGYVSPQSKFKGFQQELNKLKETGNLSKDSARIVADNWGLVYNEEKPEDGQVKYTLSLPDQEEDLYDKVSSDISKSETGADAPELIKRLGTYAGSFNKRALSFLSDAPKSVAIVANKLTPERLRGDVDKDLLYKAGKWIEEKVEETVGYADPEYTDDFANQIFSGFGDMLSFATGAGVATKVAPKVMVKSMNVTPAATTAFMGAAVNAVPEYEEIKNRATIANASTKEEYVEAVGGVDLSDEEKSRYEEQYDNLNGKDPEDIAWKSFMRNAIAGSMEAMPIATGLSRLKKLGGNKITPYLLGALESGTEEALQESMTQYFQNQTAKELYDSSRKYTEGMKDAATTGFVVGAMTFGMAGAIDSRLKDKDTSYEDKKLLEKARENVKDFEGTLPENAGEVVYEEATNEKIQELEEAQKALTEELGKENINDATKEAINTELDNINEQIKKEKDIAIDELSDSDAQMEQIKEEKDKDIQEGLDKVSDAAASLLGANIPEYSLSGEPSSKNEIEQKIDEAETSKDLKGISIKNDDVLKQKLEEKQEAFGEKVTEVTEEKVEETEEVPTEEEITEPKIEEDAIQVEEAGEVPVQPEAVISEEVAEKAPETKPKELTEEVAFSTEKEAVKESREKSEEFNQELIDDLEETKWDKVVRKAQDSFRSLDKFQKAIEKAGGSISDAMNPYQKIDLYKGKTKMKVDTMGERIIKSRKKEQPSLVEKLAKENINVEEFGKYLTALHAEERNLKKLEESQESVDREQRAVQNLEKAKETGDKNLIKAKQNELKEIRKNIIKEEDVEVLNKKSNEFVEKIESSEKGDKYKEYAKEFKDVLIGGLQNEMVESGLVSESLMDELNEMYDNYVPYYLEDAGMSAGPAKAVEARGQDVRRAKRLIDIDATDRVNPLIQSMVYYANTAERASKNEVGQSLLNLVNEFESDNFQVTKPEYKPRLTPEGVQYIKEEVKGFTRPNALEVKVKGDTYLIEGNTKQGKQIIKAMKGVGMQKSLPLIRSFNNYLRMVNTVLNPEFVLSNFIRDVQTANVNITAKEVAGLKRNLNKGIPGAMRGLIDYKRGKDSPQARVVEDMKNQGAEVSWRSLNDAPSITNKVEKSFNKFSKTKSKSDWKNVASSIRGMFDTVNDVVEQAARVSAYKAAIDAGVSKEQAASLSKNLTVNFEKKGEWSNVLDSLYLFYNAGIQGSATMIKALGKSKKARALAGAMSVIGFMLAWYNDNFDDETYEAIPEGIKGTNWTFVTDKGEYKKIPLPYGYNVFNKIGQLAYDASVGKNKNPIEATIDLLKTFMGAFNPFGGGAIEQQISPTFLDPLVEISTNKNWFGGKIKPDQPAFQAKKPESQLYFKTARPASIKAAKELNELFGGSEKVRRTPYTDISPEIIDYFWDYLGGGLGKTIANTIQTGGQLIEGDVQAENVPFVRRFLGKVDLDRKLVGDVYEIWKESGRTVYDAKETREFKNKVQEAAKKGLLDKSDKDRMLKDFYKKQREAKESLKKRK